MEKITTSHGGDFKTAVGEEIVVDTQLDNLKKRIRKCNVKYGALEMLKGLTDKQLESRVNLMDNLAKETKVAISSGEVDDDFHELDTKTIKSVIPLESIKTLANADLKAVCLKVFECEEKGWKYPETTEDTENPVVFTVERLDQKLAEINRIDATNSGKIADNDAESMEDWDYDTKKNLSTSIETMESILAAVVPMPDDVVGYALPRKVHKNCVGVFSDMVKASEGELKKANYTTFFSKLE